MTMQRTVPFNLAMESRYPEQVCVVIAKDSQGKYNPITVGWFMPTSFKPPLVAISIGKTRYSLEAIRFSKAFVVAFPSESQADDAKLFGTKTGRSVDKLAMTGTALLPATQVDSRLLKDAVANFECRLVSEVETGDHVIFVGEVIASHITENPANRLYTLVKSQHMGGLRQK
jgi:flavin reductase (DIM6/NTAB) family NADH-FMN oxidoreductase RutF